MGGTQQYNDAHTMNLTRRSVLGWGTMVAGSLGFAGLASRRAEAQEFGSLVTDLNGVLDLPAGFSYTVLQRSGATMTDGRTVRGSFDGMAAFPGQDGQIILMRNHELGENGGVSRLVLAPGTLELLSSNDVLTGTVGNCAGGPSPWGWLSCEEVAGIGGVWVCPTNASALLEGDNRRRIDDYGSFKHEAVCIDPATLVAYLTEDDGDSHLYRMVPTNAAADPFTGQLQAMKAVSADDFLTPDMTVGQSLQVVWVNVNPATARASAKAAHAAVVRRGEGIWWSDGEIYFTATSNGQVFKLVPSAEGGTLTLVANSLRGPDNITVAPWGGGDLFVAEDTNGDNYIKVVDAQGNVSQFARNAVAQSAEIAGVCFSPDGTVLFANLQKSGHTLAIRGPFPVVNPEPPPGSGGTSGTGGNGANAGAGTPTTGGAPATGGQAALPAMGGSEAVLPATGGAEATLPGSSGGTPAAMGLATGAAEDAGCGCVMGGELGVVGGPAATAALLVTAVVRRLRKDDGDVRSDDGDAAGSTNGSSFTRRPH